MKRLTVDELVHDPEFKKIFSDQSLLFKCRIRAAMRRSKREDGEADRTADLFDEAGDALESQNRHISYLEAIIDQLGYPIPAFLDLAFDNGDNDVLNYFETTKAERPNEGNDEI